MKKSLLRAFCLLGIVFVSPSLSAQESEGFQWIKSIFNKDDSDQNEKPEVNFGEVSEKILNQKEMNLTSGTANLLES